jgi:large exoprotein involved in heme utilization and adhesion
MMRRNSEISTEARGTGNGGNINIDADLLVAVPSEDSDIVANAFEGNGGNINITTQGIFGSSSKKNGRP